MPAERFLSIADAYWASFFGCPEEELFSQPCRVGCHGPELEGYWGASALFRKGKAIVSVPPGREELWRKPLAAPERLRSAEGFTRAFKPFAAVTVGPAYVCYTSEVMEIEGTARGLDASDAVAHARLEAECGVSEWEHGGSPLDHPCSGVLIEGQLASLAGYEVWGGTIAHISIVTHPDFRGMGYARQAVSHVAKRALEAGLLAQYRTLESNRASLGVAESLGFTGYASSMAVRFSADGRRPSTAE